MRVFNYIKRLVRTGLIERLRKIYFYFCLYFLRNKHYRIATGQNKGRLFSLPVSYARDQWNSYNRYQMHLMVRGTYEPVVQELLAAEIKQGFTCYDVGASYGFLTLIMSHLTGSAGKVIAFEPQAKNAAVIQYLISLNKLGNVTVVPKVVADTRGTVNFIDHPISFIGQVPETGPIFREITSYLNLYGELMGEFLRPDWRVHSLELAKDGRIDRVIQDMNKHIGVLPSLGEADRGVVVHIQNQLAGNIARCTFERVEVESVRLEDEFSRWAMPDFIKVDVEGAEPKVLKGMLSFLRENRPIMVIEMHGKGAAAKCQSVMREIEGYDFYDSNIEPIDRFPSKGFVLCKEVRLAGRVAN